MKKVIAKYSKVAEKYDHVYERHFDQMWRHIFEKEIQISEDDHVLDLGCGAGRTIQHIITKYEQHKLHLYGVDFWPEMIDASKKNLWEMRKDNHKIQLECNDCIEYLKKYEGEKYDLIIVPFLLGYVEIEKLAPALYRALKKNGQIVIITSSKEHLQELQNIFFKFAVTHVNHFNWFKVLIKKLTFLPWIGTIIKLLYENKFSKVDTELVLVKVTFEEPSAWLKWMDESAFASQFFDMVRKIKREKIKHDLVEYATQNKLCYLNEPIEKGKPFNYNWPVYKIIARK